MSRKNGSQDAPSTWFEQAFGRNVRALRRARGWSQEELARRMSAYGHQMHQVTVGKMENASRPTSMGELAALAAIFGVEIKDLLQEEPAEGLGYGPTHLLAYELQAVQRELEEVSERLAVVRQQYKQLQRRRARLVHRYRTAEAGQLTIEDAIGSEHDEDIETSPPRMLVRSQPSPQIVRLQPKNYDDAQVLGEHFRSNHVVVLDTSKMKDEEAQRVIDFAAGLVFAMRGSIDRVEKARFIMTPPAVDAETIARILEPESSDA